MQYKYVKEHLDYSDYSSGRVFYSLPGHPALPVRLASEIFQRCVAIRKTIYETSTNCVLYDPCCGAAYQLSVLAFLHGEHIQKIIASDVDEKAVALAKRNLGLLSPAGLDNRVDEISKMIEEYDKDSHRDALRSANIFKNKLFSQPETYPLETKIFQANAANSEEIFNSIEPKSVDVVLTDVPYGLHSHWQKNGSVTPLWSMLNALPGVLSSSSIVSIVSDKQQKVSHEGYQRIEQFQIGKRRVDILKPV